jgi:hypothetical protein
MMIGLGLGLTQGGQHIRPVAQIMADFIQDRYRGGVGPGLLDLFDFVAAGNRTYINALGHVVTAGVNEPRTGHHAYDAALGQWMPVGLLLEPDGQNDFKHSEALDNAVWSKGNNVTATPNGTLAGVPAFEIEDNTATYGQLTQSGLTLTGTHTVSCLVAKDVNGVAISEFGMRVTGEGLASGIMFNTETGAVRTFWDTNKIGSGAIDRGDHWKIWFAYNSNATIMSTLQIFPAHNNLTGNGTGDNMGKHTVTALQIEPGHIPGGSSYIKTVATPLARAKDSLEISAVTLAKLMVKYNRAPELVTGIEAGLPGWTASNDEGGSIYYDATFDGVVVDNVSGTARANHQLDVENGAKYLIAFTHLDGDDLSTYLSENTYGTTLTIGGEVNHIWTADADTLDVSLRQFGAGQKATTTVSVRKVTMPTRYGINDTSVKKENSGYWSTVGNIHTRVGATSWNSNSLLGTRTAGKTYRMHGQGNRI